MAFLPTWVACSERVHLLCQWPFCPCKYTATSCSSCSTSAQFCTMFHSRTPRPSSEPSKKEPLPPPLVSSSSSQKPAKPAQKRPRQEADACGQDPPKSASSSKGIHKDSSVSKHRKVDGKGSGSSTEHRVRSGSRARHALVAVSLRSMHSGDFDAGTSERFITI